MSARMDRFREALESAVEDALANVPQEVVTAVWNATDDERGRLAEENSKLRAELAQARGATFREAARLLEATGRDDDAVNLLDNMADAHEPGGTANPGGAS